MVRCSVHRESLRFVLVASAGALSGCAQPGPTASHPQQPPGLPEPPAEHSPEQGESTNTVAAVHPLLDEQAPDPEHALPELALKHLGMHIGGESNSPEAKQPYLTAIERQSDALLRCYRWVDDPTQGGSFGVDLYVGSAGGAPEVRGVRTKLGGDALVQCMTAAFLGVEFSRPARPVMLSYSLLFALE